MKTKSMNKKTLFSSIIAAVLFVSVSSAMAAWDSSSESSNCYGQPCKDWHNNGYTHTDYPDGVSFATFNGYKDAKKTRDNGTVANFREMQFTYIESELASGNGFPLPTPWESWSRYDFNSGTNYTINFGNSNQPVKIGFWGYIHNNGVADKFLARNTQIKFENWASAQPKTIYNPGFRLWAENTKPKTVWSNVTLRGDKPFTLTAKEAYIDRESGTLQFNAGQLDSLTHAGIAIKSNDANNSGEFASSHLHYALVYVEFEATPEEEQPLECAELKTNPGAGTGNDFVVYDIANPTNVPISIVSLKDTNGDAYMLENGNYATIRYCSTQDGITYYPEQYQTTPKCAEAPSNVPISFTSTKIGMVYVTVVGSETVCKDFFRMQPTTTTVQCDELVTEPGGGETINLEEGTSVTINVTQLTDTDGGEYYDPNPVFEYCYNGPIYWNNSKNTYVVSSAQCVRTTQRYMQNVLPYAPGMMYIKVVGSELTCGSRFVLRYEGQEEGQCVDLNINQSELNASRSEYTANVDVDPDDTDYQITWEVERNGNSVLSETENDNSIDLDNYNYNFVPGDTLTAQALVDGVADPDCEDSITSTEDECERFNLNRENFVRANQRICFTTDWPYFDEVRYETSNGRTGSLAIVDENCFILTKNITENADWIDIWVPGYKEVCKDRLRYEERPPLFDKLIKAEGDSVYRTDKTVATFKDNSLEYKIEYMHYNDGIQDVTITDTIGEGPIRGYVGREGDNLGGTITYDNSMEITVGGRSIDECDEDNEGLCYEGEIGDREGVTIFNLPDNERVVITYKGELDSSINPGDCSDPASVFNVQGVCGEKYKNTARFEDDTYSGDDDTELWIPCPFIIIRAGGDVVFENPLDYGVDTLYCADIANADVPIIVPEEEQPGTPSTGEEAAMPQYTGDVCKNKDAPGYQDLTGISSLICEVSFKTTQDLTQKAIVQSINTNKEKISRFEKNLNGVSVIANESMLPESRTNVYYKNDGDLTFGVGSAPVEFSKGAKTFIVEDHNVIIKSNITYADTDPNNVASIAIIVINGSVVIDPNVTETSGVLFVQEGNNANSGKVCEGPYTAGKPCQEPQEYGDKQIIHYGSIYGDIEHLFKYRVFAGDPTKEEGALVIRFDNRVYINTPPVLNELVQISQEITS